MSFLDKIKRILRIMRIRWCGVRKETKVRLLLAVTFLVIGLVLGNWRGQAVGTNKGLKKEAQNTAQLEKEKNEEILRLQSEKEVLSDKLVSYENPKKLTDLPWYLTLVNWQHEMKKDYRPKLVEIESGYYVDVRIEEPLRQMLAAAKADGMRIEICSAYRSVKRQEQIFNESARDRRNEGMEYWEAYQDTLRSVNAPGTSEHGLGLAVDLVSSYYTELDRKQAQTDEAKWLEAHCHEYGFILRYPPDKTKETGIIYEPWHYRYVGVDIATEIMEAGITLETYLKDYE